MSKHTKGVTCGLSLGAKREQKGQVGSRVHTYSPSSVQRGIVAILDGHHLTGISIFSFSIAVHSRIHKAACVNVRTDPSQHQNTFISLSRKTLFPMFSNQSRNTILVNSIHSPIKRLLISYLRPKSHQHIHIFTHTATAHSQLNTTQQPHNLKPTHFATIHHNGFSHFHSEHQPPPHCRTASGTDAHASHRQGWHAALRLSSPHHVHVRVVRRMPTPDSSLGHQPVQGVPPQLSRLSEAESVVWQLLHKVAQWKLHGSVT
jgi:hypothetical protein